MQVNLYNCGMDELPEYIAYQGDVYQIEFYFDEKGKSQARDYLSDLKPGVVKKFAHLLQMIGDAGQIRNKEKFRNEGDKIYAFKPQPHRFLCFFFDGNKIILTNAFMKKQQKLPKSEKNKALKNKTDYENRVKKGGYYGQENQK
ncbi:MAG: type II toxin-antitoxin system RelE/ParE family toxin [Marinoscillum sp.]